MTAGSPLGQAAQANASGGFSINKSRQLNHQLSSNPSATMTASNSSAAFQQVKQTQASLARLCRVQQQLQANNINHSHGASSSGSVGTNINNGQQGNQPLGSQNNNQSSQEQQLAACSGKPTGSASNEHHGQQQQKLTTFVDCLIRRFKNCFSEDFCKTVPMFVVGNLSPGSDGTHLILPPCVSLGRQNINRFSSPKNLRLMNSIRESCRSIEELDLGGNKLNDLIEVYKILQYTPNLRFLNLSENDLSRTAPVAMASNNVQPTVAGLSIGPALSAYSSSPSANSNNATNHQQWSSNNMSSQRSCLAPLSNNINNSLGARRHSTLGQSPTMSPRAAANSSTRSGLMQTRQIVSRAAETRRIAAANALAQSKKTSSIVASKLASSAASSVQSPGRNRVCGDSTKPLGRLSTSNQRQQSGSTSTMNLARSLSSLSAKDIRASNSSLSRLSSHRANGMRNNDTRAGTNRARRSATTQSAAANKSANTTDTESASAAQQATKTCVSSTSNHQKLFEEPIAESDDVDMSSAEQSASHQSAGNSNNNNNSQQQQQQAQFKQQVVTGRTYTNHSSSLMLSSTTSSSSTSFRRTFESIKALALNNTGCQWRVVCSILSRMPNLEELHLSLNNYERIDLEPNEFKHLSLKRLYLCNNPKLTNWEELDKLLIAFPSLEALSIANCNISQIPDNLDRAREWRKLCGLNINGWPIKEWPVIERLNQLPSLIDLKCRNLEILSTIDEPRHHLIARLPKLQKLNGSEIEEREDAEKAFIRFFMANSHLEKPSRFHELMQVYGEISAVDVDVDLSPPSHAQVRVIYLDRSYYRKENNDDIMMSEDFLLKLMDNADSGVVSESNNVVQAAGDHHHLEVEDEGREKDTSTMVPITGVNSQDQDTPTEDGPIRLFKDEGQEIVALNVDLRQSVRKFKSNLASLFGLDGQDLILYYIDHEMVGLMGPELLKHNQKKLWNFNVQDGDQFIVEER